jgi:hypothetical protein
MLPWPSKSPDLNPIEHFWDQLDKRVHMRQPAPQTLLQLQQALQEGWQSIPQVQIQSMRRRVTTVLQANAIHVIFRDVYYIHGVTGCGEYFEATNFKGLPHTK